VRKEKGGDLKKKRKKSIVCRWDRVKGKGARTGQKKGRNRGKGRLRVREVRNGGQKSSGQEERILIKNVQVKSRQRKKKQWGDEGKGGVWSRKKHPYFTGVVTVEGDLKKRNIRKWKKEKDHPFVGAASTPRHKRMGAKCYVGGGENLNKKNDVRKKKNEKRG